MPTGNQRHEDFIEHILLPDDATCDFRAQPCGGREEFLAIFRGRSRGDGAQRTGRR